MKATNFFEKAVHPWIPDQGNGTYANPVLHADYSDPDVIRHGKDFYLISSSLNCVPGIPILHSRDLVNWKIINHALRKIPHPSYSEVRPGAGVWAPAIRYHGGKFWIFFPMPDEGIYVTSAEDPAGEWSDPWCLQEARGWIDPCPFWDDDGSAWMVHAYAFSRAGKKERIHIRPMTPDCRLLLGEGKELFHTPHHLYLEGPKIHKINGWYYILAPGGGVPQGWQVVFRSRNLMGPYEEKVVLEKGSTPINGPHQGALVDLEDGSWMFLHFQDAGPFGRIVHMQPVRWENDWPLIGVDHDNNGVGEPVPSWQKPVLSEIDPPQQVPQTDEEFDGDRFGLQWQWQANPAASWYSLSERPGWLRLHAQALVQGSLALVPGILMQKFPARTFSAETLVDCTSCHAEAGLVVMGGGEAATLGVSVSNTGRVCRLAQDGKILYSQPVPEGPLRLRVTVDESAACQFSYASGNGEFLSIEPVFQAREGGWMGAKTGLYCISNEIGCADFDYFRFYPVAQEVS